MRGVANFQSRKPAPLC